MIYICGDIHGNYDMQKLVDFFEIEVLKQPLTKRDFVILLGDTGILWDDGPKDEKVRQVLQELPVSVLFLDGNHDNFDLLSELPTVNWHGGKVHIIESDIIHLMRGQVFEIDNKKIFIMGGANSVDKTNRIRGVSWWPEEIPNEEEYEEAERNLEKVNWKVDYIMTHTAPSEVVYEICGEIVEGEEELQQFLQMVSENTDFKGWYFGHWHIDVDIMEVYHGLMEEVIQLTLSV